MPDHLLSRLPEQIPVAAYTHINFAFAMIDPVSFAVAPMSDGDVALYPRLTALKAVFPDLKVSSFLYRRFLGRHC